MTANCHYRPLPARESPISEAPGQLLGRHAYPVGVQVETVTTRIRAGCRQGFPLHKGLTSEVTPTRSAERASRPCGPLCRPEILTVQAVPALFLRRRCPLSLRFAQRCRSGDRRSQPSRRRAGLKAPTGTPHRRSAVVEAAGIEPASESLLQRRLHAYPGCGREPAPGGAFPSFGPAPHQPGESRLGTYPWCSPTARENRRQSPPRSTSFPARQTWSGRTWLLKQPVPVQCWLLFCFHRLREVDPRHAVVASCTFVEPSTPPPHAI